jgi:hypothetical protein
MCVLWQAWLGPLATTFKGPPRHRAVSRAGILVNLFHRIAAGAPAAKMAKRGRKPGTGTAGSKQAKGPATGGSKGGSKKKRKKVSNFCQYSCKCCPLNGHAKLTDPVFSDTAAPMALTLRLCAWMDGPPA